MDQNTEDVRRELRHPFEGCVATTQQNNIISNFDTAFPYIKYTRSYDLVSLQDHNILEKRKTENERGRSGRGEGRKQRSTAHQ